MERHVFENVWDAVEDTRSEAANMSMRSHLLIAIEQRVRGWKLPHADAARQMELTEPALDDLMRGRVTKFDLDALVGLAHRAGLSVRLEIADAA